MLLRFGSTRLDLDGRQLVHEGVERHLSRKAFDLLHLLVAARPRVVTKAEIMDAIWPDAYVSEANVGILVADVRAAIGDSARAARFLRTHTGIGYSFVGEVVEQIRQAPVPVGGVRAILTVSQRKIVILPGVASVGRDPRNDILIADPSVSRFHARIHVGLHKVQVEDLDSKNGTRVEGTRITTSVPVADATEIVFGTVATRLTVELNADSSTVTAGDVEVP